MLEVDSVTDLLADESLCLIKPSCLGQLELGMFFVVTHLNRTTSALTATCTVRHLYRPGLKSYKHTYYIYARIYA